MEKMTVCLKNGGFTTGGKTWSFDESFAPHLLLKDGREIAFADAGIISRKPLKTGLGAGESTIYADFAHFPGLTFETRVLVNDTTGFVDMTFVPTATDMVDVKEVFWPQPLVAEGKDSYAVLNTMQGQLVPTDWPKEMFVKMPFSGQMCSESAYMPWWGEITVEGGYLAYVRSAWDSAYTISHPAGGPNRISLRHLPSLGKLRYARTVTYCFVPAGSDYVTLCKLYRHIAAEEGKFLTLKQKAAANQSVADLVGCCVMHVDGKSHRKPECSFYDKERPEKNDHHTPFAHWTEHVKEMKEKGVDQLYLHLDGWGQPGYDNQHPDYLPPCKELGGWDEMKRLSDTMEDCGYLFGIHDQYRDYYLDGATYDVDNALQAPDGTVFQMCHWDGGTQNYLCASLAPDYVRRNFTQLFDHGIHLRGTYLDVFTCNELDECCNPHHPMTRRECAFARCETFDYLTAHGVAPSSEEVNDWAMKSQVFCHWAPYYSETAIAAPLYNLVYHDCVMIPWKMEGGVWGIPEGTIGFLHALLNGGMGYMAEYAEGEELDKNIEQWKTLQELAHHVAFEQMEKHEFLSEDKQQQRTTFTDGTQVTVDFGANTFDIVYPAK